MRPSTSATKRQRKAVPLGDVTNLPLLRPETPTPIKPRRTARRPVPAPSAVSSTCCSSSASPSAPVTPAPKLSFAAVLDESPTICTVYARRRTTEVEADLRSNPTITNKGKEPVGAAASCPPLGKSTRNIRKKDTRPISSSAPCREAKKKRPLAKIPKLPEEFVKKQKAYFADVDAFELAEEEVSESELD